MGLRLSRQDPGGPQPQPPCRGPPVGSAGDRRPHPPAPRPRRPARERPPPRGLQVGPASRSSSLRTSERQRASQPGPAVTYRRLMVAQRLSPATVLTNRARQLGASLGAPAGPHSQPFKRRRARPAGIATPWAARGPRPAQAPPPRMPAGGGEQSAWQRRPLVAAGAHGRSAVPVQKNCCSTGRRPLGKKDPQG